jgi:excisionase family DNA binding protein
MKNPDRMLTVAQVAQILNLSESYLYQLLDAGKITHYRHGERAKRVKASDLDKYMRKVCVQAQLEDE